MGAAFVVLIALCGCGRVAFDQRSDALAGGDTGAGDNDAETAIPGLVFHAPLDGDPNTGTIDVVRSRTGTCIGACPAQVAGRFDGAYQFTAEQVRFASDAELVPNAPFTAAAWVRLDVQPTMKGNLMCKLDSAPANDDSYCLGFTVGPPSLASFYSADGVTADDVVSATGNLTLDTWHHLVMTWDGSTKTGYVDGVLIGSSTGIVIAADGFPLVLGSDSTTPGTFLVGLLDDVRIYSRALDASEVAILFQGS